MGKQKSIAPVDPTLSTMGDLISGYRSWSPKRLKKAIVEAEAAAVDLIRKVAAMTQVLYEKGADLSWMNGARRRLYLDIASGRIDPAAYEKTRGSVAARFLNGLSPSDQRKIARGEKIPLLVSRNGETHVESKDLTDLSLGEARQLLGGGRIRNEAEQMEFIEGKRSETLGRRPKKENYDEDRKKDAEIEIVLSKEKNGLLIRHGGCERLVSRSKIVKYLSELIGVDE